MEAPLNAREFLKRFHLPQLVRLTGVDDEELEEDTKMSSSATSSRSLVALAQDERSKKAQHEKSNWTYRAAASRSQQELAEDSGFRSLLIDGHHEHLYDERQFRSMRGSSSNQQQQLAASQSQIELELERDEAKEAKRFEEEKPDEKLRDERHKLGIRLTPPSKQTATTKLKLNQPFLLYKAYKKLELCAYVIDLKNELNEKSGDPIYFPQNYPGKLMIFLTAFRLRLSGHFRLALIESLVSSRLVSVANFRFESGAVISRWQSSSKHFKTEDE